MQRCIYCLPQHRSVIVTTVRVLFHYFYMLVYHEIRNHSMFVNNSKQNNESKLLRGICIALMEMKYEMVSGIMSGIY